MHFFYLDETGDTGTDLKNAEQPIFVFGGVTVRDKGWRMTTDAVQNVISDFFNGAVPNGFELHAHDLVAHQGPFARRSQEDCNTLALALLDLIITLKHRTHFIGIDKRLLLKHADGEEHDIINCQTPYLLGFNYLVSYLERFVREGCGRSARGMIIIDQKDTYLTQVDKLTHYRRFDVPRGRQLKRVVEFSHSIDSLRLTIKQDRPSQPSPRSSASLPLALSGRERKPCKCNRSITSWRCARSSTSPAQPAAAVSLNRR